jgi:imidazoleglycerol phosphate synthase glutamine amidotransferase subunit HisH
LPEDRRLPSRLYNRNGQSTAKGLGLLAGKAVRLKDRDAEGNKLKVPHMGWNHAEEQLTLVNHTVYELIKLRAA